MMKRNEKNSIHRFHKWIIDFISCNACFLRQNAAHWPHYSTICVTLERRHFKREETQLYNVVYVCFNFNWYNECWFFEQ